MKGNTLLADQFRNNENESSSPDSAQVPSLLYTLISNKYTQIIILLTIIGSGLRLYHLDYNSLWFDEVYTYIYSSKTPIEILQLISFERHPPLFYWIEHAILTFGKGEFILRFVPAICGILTIPSIYVLGKEFIDRNIGFLSAVLVTFSPAMIYYSQEARGYSLLVLLFTVLFIVYFRALEVQEIRYWVGVGILTSLIFWTDFYSIIPLSFLFLYAILVNFRDLRIKLHRFKGLVIAAVIFIVSGYPLFTASGPLYSLYANNPSLTYGPQGMEFILQVFLHFSGSVTIFAILLPVLFFIGLLQLTRFDQKKSLFVAGFVFIPLLISAYLSRSLSMNWHNLLFLLPIYLLGISVSYLAVSEKIHSWKFLSQRNVFVCFLLLFVIVSIPYLGPYYSTYQKMDFRGFSAILVNTTHDGDYVFPTETAMKTELDYYYNSTTDHTTEIDPSGFNSISGFLYPGHRPVYVVIPDRQQVPGGITIPLKNGADFQELSDLGAEEIANVTGIHLFVLP
jgi:mannosyltransferase